MPTPISEAVGCTTGGGEEFSPLVRYPGATVRVPLQYFGSVGYYAVLSRFGRVEVDTCMRFDKRFKSAHRCVVADTRGLLRLTVPVEHGASGGTWAETRVSTHAEWWQLQHTALESAYGRTPYFEFYIDRLLPLFEPRHEGSCETVAELCAAADCAVRELAGIDARVACAHESAGMAGELVGAVDLRRYDFGLVTVPEYYQIRADRLGFFPGLSILDLLFNLGPESALVLRDCRVEVSVPAGAAAAQGGGERPRV